MKAAYVKTELKSVISISEIVTLHYYEFDKSFVFSGESHDFWEMVYVDRGQVLVKRDEEELILSQGEIIFHKPSEFHAIRAYDSSPNFFVVSFDTASAAMKHFEGYHTVLDKTLIGAITGNPFRYAEDVASLSLISDQNSSGQFQEACRRWLVNPEIYTLTATYAVPGEKEKADAKVRKYSKKSSKYEAKHQKALAKS